MNCPRCGSEDIQILSQGEILCKNKSCMAVSIDQETRPDVLEME